jgi:hypothetical protein
MITKANIAARFRSSAGSTHPFIGRPAGAIGDCFWSCKFVIPGNHSRVSLDINGGVPNKSSEGTQETLKDISQRRLRKENGSRCLFSGLVVVGFRHLRAT